MRGEGWFFALRDQRAHLVRFFARFIQGHDVADYARLLARAGFVVRKRNPGGAWLGDLRLNAGNGARVANLIAPTWPAYRSGLDQDDQLHQLDGRPINAEADLSAVLRQHKPGDSVAMTFTGRTGKPTTSTVVLAEDPHIEIVPAESAGGSLTEAQKAFRRAWLGAK